MTAATRIDYEIFATDETRTEHRKGSEAVRVYSVFNRSLPVLLVGGLLAGCGRVPDDTVDTGAKECVQTFYQALIDRDWPGAYAVVEPQQQKTLSPEQFGQLCQRFWASLGFEPEAIHIQACQEHGSEAVAHVVLTGRSADQQGRYKDAVSLHRGADGWRIVLLATFGRRSLRAAHAAQ
jgi:hypothetical protein